MTSIAIRRDKKRGCGWRKPGGLYLVAEGLSRPCGKLPIPLDACPTCHAGIHPARGWTWIDGDALGFDRECASFGSGCLICPLAGKVGRVGLLWIGGQFYPTPADWIREAQTQGISRRISAVPKDFVAGQTWVFVAHRKAILQPNGRWTAGVFHAFKPKAVEYIVRGDEKPEELDALRARGITPVQVERVGDDGPLVAAISEATV